MILNFLKGRSFKKNLICCFMSAFPLRAIDDIVLSYVVSILEELGTDVDSPESFDGDGFSEMMEAYIPGFGSIDWCAMDVAAIFKNLIEILQYCCM
jgi:hypothetical protein